MNWSGVCFLSKSVKHFSFFLLLGEDEFLGRATIDTSVVAEKGEINNMWANLEDVPNGKILMSLSWLTTTKDKSVLQSKNFFQCQVLFRF